MNNITRIWRKDFNNCPINKRVHILGTFDEDGTLTEFVGTVTINSYTGQVTRGDCIEGDPELFYRMKWIYWSDYYVTKRLEVSK